MFQTGLFSRMFYHHFSNLVIFLANIFSDLYYIASLIKYFSCITIAEFRGGIYFHKKDLDSRNYLNSIADLHHLSEEIITVHYSHDTSCAGTRKITPRGGYPPWGGEGGDSMLG